MLGQNDVRHDGASRLSFSVSDLVKARHVSIDLLLLCATDEVAIGAEPLGQFLAVPGVRFRCGASDGEARRYYERKDGEHPSEDGNVFMRHVSRR